MSHETRLDRLFILWQLFVRPKIANSTRHLPPLLSHSSIRDRSAIGVRGHKRIRTSTPTQIQKRSVIITHTPPLLKQLEVRGLVVRRQGAEATVPHRQESRTPNGKGSTVIPSILPRISVYTSRCEPHVPISFCNPVFRVIRGIDSGAPDQEGRGTLPKRNLVTCNRAVISRGMHTPPNTPPPKER